MVPIGPFRLMSANRFVCFFSFFGPYVVAIWWAACATSSSGSNLLCLLTFRRSWHVVLLKKKIVGGRRCQASSSQGLESRQYLHPTLRSKASHSSCMLGQESPKTPCLLEHMLGSVHQEANTHVSVLIVFWPISQDNTTLTGRDRMLGQLGEDKSGCCGWIWCGTDGRGSS